MVGSWRKASIWLCLALAASCGSGGGPRDLEGSGDVRFTESRTGNDGRPGPEDSGGAGRPDAGDALHFDVQIPQDSGGDAPTADAPTADGAGVEMLDDAAPPLPDAAADGPDGSTGETTPGDSGTDGVQLDSAGDVPGSDGQDPGDPCFEKGIPVNCDDGVPCTVDACKPGSGCQSTPQDSACDDGIGCTQDQCVPEAGCTHGAVDSACDDGNVCTAEKCDPGTGCVGAGTEPGPCTWPGNWFLSMANPVLTPTATDADQGADNIYAPDVLWYDGEWWMWYGGQGSDGHDAIFVATSQDLLSWKKYPSASNPVPVVDHGGANHVNDPSVVYVGGTFYMYYTEAPTGENDRIHLATSGDGLSWTKKGMVLDVGPAGSWEPDRVGRPAVLYEEGQFRMWYDGQIYGVARHVGYATSADGYTWTKHAGNPVLLHQGAVDVDRVGPWYVLLSESGSGTLLFVAKSPTQWTSVGQVFGKSGAPYDAYGQVTPFLLVDGGTAKGILFGGASHSCWCKNRIALALPNGSSDNPGCGGCLVGYSDCDSACQGAGLPGGFCGNPGSTNPDACCTCEGGFTDCQGCLAGYADCNDACHHAGKPGGTCAEPASTDPSKCCACLPDTGCEGCLAGKPTCMAACKAIGASGGWCAAPGSQNPAACCACY